MAKLPTRFFATLLAVLLLLPASAPAQDWGAEGGDDRRQEIIRRYRTLLERRPAEGAVFDRLLQEVGGGRALDALIADYERRATEDPDEFALHVLLGHLYKRTGRIDEAVAAYQRAIELDSDNPLPVQSLADAFTRASRWDEARQAYERALELSSDELDQQDILMALADIAFAARNFDEAAGYLERIVEISPRDPYLREQLADVYIEHGRSEDAIAQYEALVEMSGRDTRQRAMALGAIGDVLAELGRLDEAVERLRQAQALVSRDSWLWADLERRVIDAFRAGGDLAGLVAEYEERWTRPDFEQMRILVELYEELGREEDALEMARTAVARNRRSIDARLDLIRILERRGAHDEAIDQYEAVMDLSEEPIHGFRLAQLHRDRGDEAAGLAVLEQMERRYRDRPNTLSQVADHYLRWGHRDRALTLYERLAELDEQGEALVTLGALHFMDGNRDEALATWARIPEVVTDPAEAQALLGRVYAAHGLIEQAIEAYGLAREADPSGEAVTTELAEVLEDSSRYNQALETWSALLAASTDPVTRADARRRIVDIYRRQGVLRDRMAELQARFEVGGEPADGYLLGAGYLALRELEQAELVFLRLLELNEDDVEALASLATLYSDAGRAEEAIGVLERLADLDADGAREHYSQIVDLALSRFDEARAVEFANRLIQLNPNDARGYARLGEVYQRSQHGERALAAFREAIRLDGRDLGYAFSAAEVAAALGRPAEAAEELRRVVHQSRDEGEVLRAGQWLVQLAPTDAGLESLLTEWQGLLYRPNLERPVRQLALQVVDRLTAGPALLLGEGGPDDREWAAAELTRLAPLSSRPLLAGLTDADTELRVAAARLLARVGTEESAVPLANALSDPDDRVRTAAAVALGLLPAGGAEALLGALHDQAAEVRGAAAWAVGQRGEAAAVEPLLGLVDGDRDSDVRALAALSLGRLGDPRAVTALRRLATDEADIAWAGAWGLGALGARDESATLVQLLGEGSPAVRRAAAWSLGRIGPDAVATAALLEAYWTNAGDVRAAAARALSGATSEPAVPARLRVEPQLGVAPADLLPLWAPADLASLPAEPLESAVSAAAGEVAARLLSGGDEGVIHQILEDLGIGDGAIGLLAVAGPMPAAPLVGPLSALLDSGDAGIRAGAAAALGGLGSSASGAGAALEDRLDDEAASVRRAAAIALGELGAGVGALQARWDGERDCSVRAAIAQAMVRLGRDLGGLSDERCALVSPELR